MNPAILTTPETRSERVVVPSGLSTRSSVKRLSGRTVTSPSITRSRAGITAGRFAQPLKIIPTSSGAPGATIASPAW